MAAAAVGIPARCLLACSARPAMLAAVTAEEEEEEEEEGGARERVIVLVLQLVTRPGVVRGLVPRGVRAAWVWVWVDMSWDWERE